MFICLLSQHPSSCEENLIAVFHIEGMLESSSLIYAVFVFRLKKIQHINSTTIVLSEKFVKNYYHITFMKRSSDTCITKAVIMNTRL
jgi:hypothetical protein